MDNNTWQQQCCLLLPSLVSRPSYRCLGGVLSDTPCHMGRSLLCINLNNQISHPALKLLTDYTFSNLKVTILHVARKIMQLSQTNLHTILSFKSFFPVLQYALRETAETVVCSWVVVRSLRDCSVLPCGSLPVWLKGRQG